MKLKFKKLAFDAIVPQAKHEGDSGMDICSAESYSIGHEGSRHTFKTNIAAEIPEGYELQVRPRSGLAANNGVWAIFGTIDQGYRGEIMITLVNLGHEHYFVNKGDCIAQLVLAPVVHPEIEVVEYLAASERGSDGFGSTGVRG